jgi:ubiquinol-cytochrome c reductase iron-sulfur subunit
VTAISSAEPTRRCIPLPRQGNFGGSFRSRHCAKFISSGRVRQGIRQGPARRNLPLPPHQFLSASKIKIGETSQA